MPIYSFKIKIMTFDFPPIVYSYQNVKYTNICVINAIVNVSKGAIKSFQLYNYVRSFAQMLICCMNFHTFTIVI